MVSFTSMDTLSNFFAGVMIYWDQPFLRGDWIRFSNGQIECTVGYVGWYFTRIIWAFDKRLLYVTKGILSNIAIENLFRITSQCCKVTVWIRYSDSAKILQLVKAIEDMLRKHLAIDTTQILFANLFELGLSLKMMGYSFTKTTERIKPQAI